jgi:F-type H+-transporting ATPase subunit alpha
MVELLKQPQYTPYGVNDQVLAIFAGTQGHLDDLPLERVAAFERALLEHFHGEFPEVLAELEDKKILTPELQQRIGKIVVDFKSHFGK